MAADHVPVLRDEVAQALAHPGPGLAVDGTLGAGGHAEALLEASGPAVRLLGLDRDPDAVGLARARLAGYGERVVVAQRSFDELTEAIAEVGGDDEPVVALLLDLGVSSMQLDQGARGFSLRRDGPLDMRMDPSRGEPASALLDRLDEAGIARVLRAGGEDRHPRRIASAIARARPLRTTGELADTVAAAVPARARAGATHPATRTFQALRIAVNDELDRLARVLPQALHALARPAEDPAGRGGRLAVLSYHSLEDRLVKRVLAAAARGCVCPPDLPVCGCGRAPAVTLHPRGGTVPTREEVAANPRARSARLRVAARSDADLPPDLPAVHEQEP